MPLSGTFINVAAVIGGTLAGTLIGDRLPGRVRETVMHALGLVVLVVGMDGALAAFRPPLSTLTRGSVLIVLGSVLVGGIVGELLRIEDRSQSWTSPHDYWLTESRASGCGQGSASTGFRRSRLWNIAFVDARDWGDGLEVSVSRDQAEQNHLERWTGDLLLRASPSTRRNIRGEWFGI